MHQLASDLASRLHEPLTFKEYCGLDTCGFEQITCGVTTCLEKLHCQLVIVY